MTILDTKKFIFPDGNAYAYEITDGTTILDWMDTEIKKSPCIDIQLQSVLAS